MLPDQKLVELCLKKDSRSLDELYNSFSGKMFGVCLRYAKNRTDAQDLLHDGFVKVYTGLHEYKGNGSLEGWIRRIMVNTAINFYKRRTGKFFGITESDEENITGYSEDIIGQISTQELLHYVNEMPDGYRLVFNMYVIEGYKHIEISELLGISEATSKTQFMKARRYLMKKVKQMEYESICR